MTVRRFPAILAGSFVVGLGIGAVLTAHNQRRIARRD